MNLRVLVIPMIILAGSMALRNYRPEMSTGQNLVPATLRTPTSKGAAGIWETRNFWSASFDSDSIEPSDLVIAALHPTNGGWH